MSQTIGFVADAKSNQVTGTGQCDPANPDRKRFYTEGVALHVPNWIEDRRLRWLIDQGQDLYTAYRDAGLIDILPEKGLQDCVYDNLRTKYYDKETGRWRIAAGNFTCIGFWDCFVKYIEALRESQIRGRIKIAEDLTAPSPQEAQCIKNRFAVHKNLARAYSECGAKDIIPTAILAQVSSILLENPKAHLYDILKTVYRMTKGEEPEPVLTPHEHISTETKDNTLLYIAGGVAAALILSRI